MSNRKPSLEATADLSGEEVAKVSTRMFGAQKFIDYEKFSQLCFEDRLPRIKAELLECNEGRFEEEILSLTTVEELHAFVQREDVELTHNALTAVVQGGRLFRIDNVKPLSGGMTLNWSAAGQGFGQMRFFVGEDGKLHVDSECMGPHFIRSVLMRLVDELVIHD